MAIAGNLELSKEDLQLILNFKCNDEECNRIIEHWHSCKWIVLLRQKLFLNIPLQNSQTGCIVKPRIIYKLEDRFLFEPYMYYINTFITPIIKEPSFQNLRR